MPTNVEYIFRAISNTGDVLLVETGFSDDFSDALECFYTKAMSQHGKNVVRVTSDLALDPKSFN